jgi:hypothetical protein
VNGELVVDGWADRSSHLGAQSWRVVKSGTAGTSSGYLPLKTTTRPDRIREITKLDVFEITLCMAPANARTRGVALEER